MDVRQSECILDRKLNKKSVEGFCIYFPRIQKTNDIFNGLLFLGRSNCLWIHKTLSRIKKIRFK